MDLLSPIIAKFVTDQEQSFNTFVDRSLEIENWSPITNDIRFFVLSLYIYIFRNSYSAIDLFSMFSHLPIIFFSLKIPPLIEFFIGTIGGRKL